MGLANVIGDIGVTLKENVCAILDTLGQTAIQRITPPMLSWCSLPLLHQHHLRRRCCVFKGSRRTLHIMVIGRITAHLYGDRMRRIIRRLSTALCIGTCLIMYGISYRIWAILVALDTVTALSVNSPVFYVDLYFFGHFEV